MFRIDAGKPIDLFEGMKRREFMQMGALSYLGLTLSSGLVAQDAAAVAQKSEKNCIFLFLVGGPSQLDTFDPKPDAPQEIRSPFKAIKTNASGVRLTEIFPETAKVADKFAILRTMHHSASGVHDTGHQLMQTGRLYRNTLPHPHAGCVLSYLRGSRYGMPTHIALPQRIGHTGGNMPHGQDAGFLGKRFDPYFIEADPCASNLPDLAARSINELIGKRGKSPIPSCDTVELAALRSASSDNPLFDCRLQEEYAWMTSPVGHDALSIDQEPDSIRERYGRNRFGQSCLLARRLVERGVRFVTVNMFDTVFNKLTWDIHGVAPFSDMRDMRDIVAPMFDKAYSALLRDMEARGMLKDTLIVAMGEFGRTPKINPAGGRDHWPKCWSMLFAGGDILGGQYVGASDTIAAEPRERPATPAEALATVYHHFGINLDTELVAPGGRVFSVVERGVQPIMELFTGSHSA